MITAELVQKTLDGGKSVELDLYHELLLKILNDTLKEIQSLEQEVDKLHTTLIDVLDSGDLMAENEEKVMKALGTWKFYES